MKTRGRVGALVLAGAAVLAVAGVALGGNPAKIRIGKRPAPRPGVFNLTTTYTGYLSGTIRVGNVEYLISPRATIYVVGQGVLEPGIAVSDASIYLSGRRGGGEAVVNQIVVRRKEPGSTGKNDTVGVLPAGAPS